MLDPHRLRVLVALARAGTVAGAAADLGYGAPTISHHLSRLEAETGAVLVQRVGRGLRLTPEGRRLAQRGAEILALLQRADDELAMATSLRAGRVRLAVFPSAASTIAPAALTVLRERHPGVEVHLMEAEPPQARELLRAGTADVAVVFGYAGDAEPAGFHHRVIGDDPVFLVVPRVAGHRQDAEVPATLEGYAEARWIAGCEQCRRQLLDLAAGAGFAPRIGFASDDFVAVQHLVASGFGVALLPDLALQAYRHPDVVALPVAGAGRTLRIVTFGEPPPPRQVAALVAAILVARPVRADDGPTVAGGRDLA